MKRRLTSNKEALHPQTGASHLCSETLDSDVQARIAEVFQPRRTCRAGLISNKKRSSRKECSAPGATKQIKVLGAPGVEFPGQNPLSLLSTPTLLCARRLALRDTCCRKGDASWENQF